MRIGFFVPRCTPDNSHGRYVIELAQSLADDHEVTVYSGTFWPPLRTGIRCHYLPVLIRPTLARLATLWMSSSLVTMARHFDVVHIQGADAPIGNVITAHCCNAAMEIASGKSQRLRRKLNYSLGAIVERYCMKRPTTRMVIAVSHKVKREIELHYGVDPQKVVVIPNGVDAERFHPRNRIPWRKAVREGLGLACREFVILYVGGDYHVKGLVPLLEGVRSLNSQAKILAVGVEPDQFLIKLLDREDQKSQVSFVGSTANIAPYYAAADCFVLPTLYDTFSLVTLEAMACGLPVIVSQEAGVSEILQHGVDSLLLRKPWDVKELTQRLYWLVTDEGFRTMLGENARKTAERYSWDEVVKKTLAVYCQAVEA